MNIFTKESVMSVYIILSVCMVLICLLDICRVIDLSRKWLRVFYFVFAPHLPLFWMLFYLSINHSVNHTRMENTVGGNALTTVLFIICNVIFQLYTTLRLHFQGLRKKKTSNSRVNIIFAGRNLIHSGLIGLYLLPLWYLVCYLLLPYNPYSALVEANVSVKSGVAFLSFEVIYSMIFVWLFLINGCLRIFFGSRNLVIAKRLFIVLFMWVPFVQLYLAHILCASAKDEYLVAVSRESDTAFSVTDNLCQTKYPLIMVHGIGFRDLRHFNYWGRIPRLLQQHGATVYYGHQNAWGTIEDNAAAIKKVIDQALIENHCDKVNIIAHSKGGLDCRYLISSLGYGDKVASLTTINTPHRGSELITILSHLPDGAYRFIANQLNKPFMLAGETEPDCYSSSKQLDPVFCEEFNKKNLDVPGVYYQSYTSILHNLFSDSLLFIPYLLMCTQKGRQNDGLVDVSSAVWGNFRGVLKSRHNRGISHGDMIDLKREDIKGFDVLKLFYDMVCELKSRGY